MKVAILGGGFAGLTAAYHLSKKGHAVTLFEKENALGGLAVGFKEKNWNWYLERAYHHLFANDYDILDFAKETGFEKIIFRSPETASIYNTGNVILGRSEATTPESDSGLRTPFVARMTNNYRIYPLDTPQDFLRFPLLSWPAKVRSATVLAFLKLSPFLSAYEKQSAEGFLKKYMGQEAWNVLWQQLFRKKFGKYAGNIVASFIWARIKKRTKDLGYIEGGFQTLINYLENKLQSLRVDVLTGCEIREIEKNGGKFTIKYSDLSHPERSEGSLTNARKKPETSSEILRFAQNDKIITQMFDVVISTLPTAIMSKLTENIFSKEYLTRFRKLKYLHAVNLVVETTEPLLEKTYWLNVCSEKLPLMALVQHTNFMDKKNYGGNHILYVGWYVEREDGLLRMSAEEIAKFIQPHLNKINSKFGIRNSKIFLFRGPFAQPIFDSDFVKNKPEFITPVKNFFIANLDMTYPYDRGTNYAVKLGKQVAGMI